MTLSSLAGHAVELLDKIVRSDPPADKIISEFYRQRRYLGSHDRRWITEKVYGIIRNFILLREIVEECSSGLKPLNVFLLYEILIAGMEPNEISNIYSQLLESYRLAGSEIDLESLLKCSARQLSALKDNEFALNSFPTFFRAVLPPSVKDECVQIMQALNHEARVCIRVDTSKISRDEAIDSFRIEGIETSPSYFSPLGLYLPGRINLNTVALYKNGAIEIQEEASQLVGLIVEPGKGEVVVDTCAGGGGKSLEFASLSGGMSEIHALDVDKERIDNLMVRAARSGYGNISSRVVSRESFDGIEELVGCADKVVIDAPCSGSGTIRRNPDKKFRLTRESVGKKAAYQKFLLEHYSQLVRVGGLLFYVTCSIFEEENRSVIKSFANSNRNFEFVEVSSILTEKKFSGLIEDGFLSIYPHRADMDGFFVAVMKRVG
ncbi:MAG TPA: hypothetical protein VLX91_03615 [Candidatus Acidoferrales bacterium]|nr:hypothetical protein [Candidatus Acidoferrales bacterium]